MATDNALVEMVFALVRHYGFSRQRAGFVIGELTSISSINCNRDRVARAIEFWEDHPKLSFEDCLMAEHCADRDAAPLWTFDAKLSSQHPAASQVPG